MLPKWKLVAALFPLDEQERQQSCNRAVKSDNEAATCCRFVAAPKCLEEILRGIASRIGKVPIRELPSGPPSLSGSDYASEHSPLECRDRRCGGAMATVSLPNAAHLANFQKRYDIRTW